MKKNKLRIDLLLIERGLFESRTKAQSAIMAGLVFADEKKIEKPGTEIPISANIEVKGEVHPYVGRGGVKLEHALDEFKLEVKDKVIIDVGASTGGFTDCLLQRGAKKVYAIDVGYGQLAWKLRSDKRVVAVERQNIRELGAKDLYKDKSEKADLAVIDVSFISLSKVLPSVYNLLKDGGDAVALVKPQFEAEKEEVEKGGLIKKGEIHEKVLNKVIKDSESNKFGVLDATFSPITGADGNLEFFVYLKKDARTKSGFDIGKIVEEAHRIKEGRG